MAGTNYRLVAADFEGLSEDQNEAILEALVIAEIADGRLSAQEEDLLGELADDLRWCWGNDPKVLHARTHAAEQRVIAEINADKGATYLSRLKHRLPAETLRQKVYWLMAKLVFADKELTPAEDAVLQAWEHGLGLEPKVAEAIRLEAGSAQARRSGPSDQRAVPRLPAELCLDPEVFRALSLDGQLAILELAIQAVWSDGKLTIAEHQFIEQHLKPLPWRWGPGEVALADRIQQVFEKVRSFKGDTVAREAYRKGFKDRLPSPELRRKAFAMMVAICAADGEVAESELAMLDAFGPGYLAIAQDEVARTAQAVLQAMGLGAQQ